MKQRIDMFRREARAVVLLRAPACAVICAVVCALGLLAGPGAAQWVEPYDADPAAMKALERVVEAYRARPALGVKSVLAIELAQGDMTSEKREVTAEIVCSRRPGAAPHGSAGRLVIRDFDCTFVDGKFLATHKANEDAYYEEDYEDTPYWTLLIGFQDIPYPHLAIFWGEAAMEDLCMQLLPESPNLVPTKVEDAMVEGRRHQRIELTSPVSSLILTVDAKSRLISSMVHELSGGPAVREGTVKKTTYALTYTEHEKPLADHELRIDSAGREKVEMLSALIPPPDPAGGGVAGGGALIGKAAPPLILATAAGGAVDLEDLRGKVVVLDFWATWCGPCRRALPLLHQVNAWVREEALPVEIITVNVWESRDADGTPDQRLESVRAFWTKNGYTLPVAMDYTDEVAAAYGVRGIPATFVIRSDGVVHAQPHASVESLKEQIQSALDALEAADE